MALERERETKMSVEEFFELMESDPGNRYEYIDGDVYMMTGGTPRHAAIGSNLCRILGNVLLDRPCVVYNSDVCVELSETRYVCPDVTVSCDPRDHDSDDDLEEEDKVLRYPSLVVEVLSPGTRSRDRGKKVRLYKDCPGIQEYLIVDAEVPGVQLYRREADDLWTVHMFGLEDTVALTSLDVHFSIAEIYAKTRFTRQS